MQSYATAMRYFETQNPARAPRGYARLLEMVLNGDAEALSSIGSLLKYGVGLRCAPEFTFACYLAAAKRGNPGAQYNLASVLIEGDGTTRDVKKGLRLLRTARRNGSSEATNYLGFCYRTGEGVKKDPRRGFALSLEAAEAGVAAAQHDVGMCFLTGTGVEKDPAAARRWISRAARGGDRHAQEYLEQTHRRRARRPSKRRPKRDRFAG